MSAATDRIAAEHKAFIAWRPPADLEWPERQHAAADRSNTALARLVGSLIGYIRTDGLTPDAVVDAVEYALRVPDEALAIGMTHEPKPLPGPFPSAADHVVSRVAVTAGGAG